MICGAMSSAGVGPLCFLKTNVTSRDWFVYQEILEHFMLPFAVQLFKDADFIFQQDLAPVHTAKSTKSWLNNHCLVCLTGQQTHQSWTPERIYGVLSRGKWETRDQKMQMSWRPQSKKPGLSYQWTYFQKANNSIQMFFLLVLWSILICCDSELVGFC